MERKLASEFPDMTQHISMSIYPLNIFQVLLENIPRLALSKIVKPNKIFPKSNELNVGNVTFYETFVAYIN